MNGGTGEMVSKWFRPVNFRIKKFFQVATYLKKDSHDTNRKIANEINGFLDLIFSHRNIKSSQEILCATKLFKVCPPILVEEDLH
jgi:hypothetical protein